MKNIRTLALMGVGGVVAGFAAYRLRQNAPTNTLVSTPQNSSHDSAWSNTDYLNFDFGALLGDTHSPVDTGQAPMIKPRGIANHNPLNIRENHKSDYQWQGEAAQDIDPSFEEFTTPFWGIRAGARILKTYRDKRGLNHVKGIVTRWAPPSDDNPTDKYIAFVANKAGVLATQPLGAADYPKVIAAMIHFENGYNPYDESIISSATAEGFA